MAGASTLVVCLLVNRKNRRFKSRIRNIIEKIKYYFDALLGEVLLVKEFILYNNFFKYNEME